MNRIPAYSIIFVLLACAICWPTIINIPADWPTIQQGIDASADGDTVLVQPGTYVENISIDDRNIVLGSLYLTTGDTSIISQTIIDGDSAGAVIIIQYNYDNEVILKGFKIMNGYHQHGVGGIICRLSSPIISNNIIYGNYGLWCGGIYCIDNSNPTIKNNIISGNSGWVCGGIYCELSSNPIICDNLITGNSAEIGGGGINCEFNCNATIINNAITYNSSDRGGGINFNFASPTIMGNIIKQNFADYGGGIFCNESSPFLINNTISENIAGLCGGAIHCSFSTSIISNNKLVENTAIYGGAIYFYESYSNFINNIIAENTAENGDGFYFDLDSYAFILNSILWANGDEDIFLDPNASITITYSDIQDTLWPGVGNISLDPMFRDPAYGDFHLLSVSCGDSTDSPCIDMGDPTIQDIILDCDWGLGTFTSDMGAYGGGDSSMLNIGNYLLLLPENLLLDQNFPNPFNAATTVKYTLPEAGPVRIDIYDLLGRMVETLVDEEKQAGQHQVVWEASDFSSGVYFYRIEAGNFTQSKKMILLK